MKIYCDFDGTIAVEDVGNAFFETFAGDSIWTDISCYERGEITAQELYQRTVSKLAGLSDEALDEFCRSKEIDPTFVPFVDWCESLGIPLTIVSDGMDVYVQRLLRFHNLDVRFYCNELHLMPDGSARVVFPFADEMCDLCANCKRNHLMVNSADDDIIVMIGDGYSDRCPVKYADVVFAKSSLEKYCQRENVTFTAFRTFDDVRRKLESILSKKRFRKPKQPELRRKRAWMME